MPWELEYYKIAKKIMEEGEDRIVRNGATKALFHTSFTIDMEKEGFPILRGRKMHYKGVLGELAAFFRGPTNIEDFKKFGCNYWDEWGDMEGYLKVDYGNSWIDFNGVNQLKALVEGIKKDPTGRRHIVSGWRPDKLAELSLPCCHLLYQFYIRDGKYIDMIWYQRSADWMIGVPSDVILAAAWLTVLAAETDYITGRINMVFGDSHIYDNHFDQVETYFDQVNEYSDELFKPIDFYYNLTTSMERFVPEDIIIEDFVSAPSIKFKLNV